MLLSFLPIIIYFIVSNIVYVYLVTDKNTKGKNIDKSAIPKKPLTYFTSYIIGFAFLFFVTIIQSLIGNQLISAAIALVITACSVGGLYWLKKSKNKGAFTALNIFIILYTSASIAALIAVIYFPDISYELIVDSGIYMIITYISYIVMGIHLLYLLRQARIHGDKILKR